MSEEEITMQSPGLIGKLCTPEAIIMISFATFIDAGEAFFECFPPVGTILSVMLDIAALIFIGLWMYFFRAKNPTVSKKAFSRMKKIIKKGKKYKFLKPLCIIFEMIPIVSSIAPLWIGVVLLELASDD